MWQRTHKESEQTMLWISMHFYVNEIDNEWKDNEFNSTLKDKHAQSEAHTHVFTHTHSKHVHKDPHSEAWI